MIPVDENNDGHLITTEYLMKLREYLKRQYQTANDEVVTLATSSESESCCDWSDVNRQYPTATDEVVPLATSSESESCCDWSDVNRQYPTATDEVIPLATSSESETCCDWSDVNRQYPTATDEVVPLATSSESENCCDWLRYRVDRQGFFRWWIVTPEMLVAALLTGSDLSPSGTPGVTSKTHAFPTPPPHPTSSTVDQLSHRLRHQYPVCPLKSATYHEIRDKLQCLQEIGLVARRGLQYELLRPVVPVLSQKLVRSFWSKYHQLLAERKLWSQNRRVSKRWRRSSKLMERGWGEHYRHKRYRSTYTTEENHDSRSYRGYSGSLTGDSTEENHYSSRSYRG